MGKNSEIDKRRKRVADYSLIELAKDLGFTPKRRSFGRYYTLEEHDSVQIKIETNTFKRYMNGAGGDPLAFLIEFGPERSNKFKSINYSLYWLEKKKNISNTVKLEDIKTDFEKEDLVLPERDSNNHRVFAYLNKTRHISKEVISEFLHRKILFQDEEHKNCVFVTYEQDKPVFACVKSTSTNYKFQREFRENDYTRGIEFTNNSDTLVIFESPIDMMSYITLNPHLTHKYDFLAIGGTGKILAVDSYLQNNRNTTSIIIAVDNDNGGRKCVDSIKQIISNQKKALETIVIYPRLKDWNEDLCDLYSIKENELSL